MAEGYMYKLIEMKERVREFDINGEIKIEHNHHCGSRRRPELARNYVGLTWMNFHLHII